MNETENVEALISYLSGMLEDIILDYRKNWQRDRELGYPGYEGVRNDDATTTQDEFRELRRKEIARLNTILPRLEESYINKLRQSWQSLTQKIRQSAHKDPTIFRQVILLVQMQLQITSFNYSSRQKFYPNDPNLRNETQKSHTICSDSEDQDDMTKSPYRCDVAMSDARPSKDNDISRQYYDQGINADRHYTEQQSLLLNGLFPKSKNVEKDEKLDDLKTSQRPWQGDKTKTAKRHSKYKSDSKVLDKLKTISRKQIRHQSKFLRDTNKKTKPVH